LENIEKLLGLLFMKIIEMNNYIEESKQRNNFNLHYYYITSKFDGNITFEDLSVFMKKQNYSFTVSDWKVLLRTASAANSGHLTKKEFENLINP
jgi:Ca2+-binding EF-hand superfamily protein